MRSRTSRGVPEWSGGKDLYMGSPVLVTGKVSGAIGNVPGPPGGSRGSTRWGHRPQRAAWAKCGKGPAPRWAGAPPTRGPRRREGGKGETVDWSSDVCSSDLRESFGGYRYCTGTTGRVPGVHQVGPPTPEGCMGQVWEGTSPRWAGAPPHKGPRRLGFGGGSKPT